MYNNLLLKFCFLKFSRLFKIAVLLGKLMSCGTAQIKVLKLIVGHIYLKLTNVYVFLNVQIPIK